MKNDQTYFQNHAVWKTLQFYVEPFIIIIQARVKAAKGSSPILVVILTEFKQIN